MAGKWDGLGEFPDDLQWEALVDVVRGRVKVNAHCYEAVDLDALVRVRSIFVFVQIDANSSSFLMNLNSPLRLSITQAKLIWSPIFSRKRMVALQL